ncbi:adenylate/guanylate cyclase domain-containing protein [Rosistilla oblonga]|uniref:Adenylate cyclase 1 n=2 Tax=Rosistilla oblonga TaxID=2527990 RepID=A0A518IPN5_9BACT|nr:adenylate/guanylate cyclase domain-containing protein [Rosistilla oblonga]QDV55054.1 Adenylate cyclase 1 [Rosistilla oblonga]
MLDLVVQGSRNEDRWRRPVSDLDASHPIVLGRDAGTWSIPWDDRISRQHVRMTREGKQLRIRRIAAARNPIFFKGQQSEEFLISVGEHFVVGATTFTLVDRPQLDSPDPEGELTQHAFDAQQLRRNPFRDAGQRIEVLRRLPELISGSNSDQELWVRVATVLLQGIPSASAVAVVGLNRSDTPEISVQHFDSRVPTSQERAPSASLVRKSLESGESILHLWNGGRESQFTQLDGIDWAFCVPVISGTDGLGLYVAGAMAGLFNGPAGNAASQAADVLQDDLKFSELVATTIGNLRDMRALQRRQAGLQQFFAPVVMNALGNKETEDALAPRETELSALFCDLRGFSRQSEKAQGRLLELLERVSEALGVMTRHILDSGGVIGDFHGDAAMGFWGWPIAQVDAPGRACAAALAILEEFTSAGSDGRLADFRCGIGISSGRAVAGRIGTVDQVKVTAFGPVVNLASRLEGMTKQLSAEILVDEITARYVRDFVPPTTCRIRRLARVRPAGIETPLVVSQILPPEGPLCGLTDADIATYEEALDALLDKRWGDAFERLHAVPAADRAKDFLTVYIAQHGRVAPSDWNGVIDLPKY